MIVYKNDLLRIDELRETDYYNSNDRDAQIFFTKEEIKNGYGTYFGREISDEEVDDMFSKVDTDNSGEIDYSEFVIATMSEKQILHENKIQTAFKMFDKDGGGSISKEEIKQILSFGQSIDEDTVNQIMKQVDDNGDGEISYQEFSEMMLG